MATNLEKCCKENREHLTFIFHRNGCPIISNYFILFLIKDISHILFPQNSQTPFLVSTIAKWFNNQVMCFLLHLSSPEKKNSHCSNKLQKIVAIFMAKSFWLYCIHIQLMGNTQEKWYIGNLNTHKLFLNLFSSLWQLQRGIDIKSFILP